MVDLAGYVIYVLIRPKGVLWDLDRWSEKANPVFEHLFRQVMSAKISMCEWNSFPSHIETFLSKWVFSKYWNKFSRAALSRMSTYISELPFPTTGNKGPSPNHEKHSHIMMLLPPNFTVGTMQSLKKLSPDIHEIQIHLPDYSKVRIITLKNVFSACPQFNGGKFCTIAIDASHSGV
ncbi:hypothetical protein TNCV_3412901 [Trichonephila clavipes]|uniref:Uncharacterized protein n=1 Tax=Trichonephila clavipes TaxID=2585209 RepID=A0A8X6RRN7_TRICX|nr:hypothetical protein TNCV_3412901 [Trichonephila clavipes]